MSQQSEATNEHTSQYRGTLTGRVCPGGAIGSGPSPPGAVAAAYSADHLLHHCAVPHRLCHPHLTGSFAHSPGARLFQCRITTFFGHYTRLLSNSRFLVYILNSAINSIGGAALTTFCVALAGYAFARFRFRGRRALLAFLLALLMLPNLTNLIPLYKLASDLQLRDTYLIMILVYASYGVPLGIWIMKGFFESIPRELEEAAAVDGAGLWTMLWRIIIPLALPGLTSVMIINFVYNWNDFLTALILLSSTAMKTATVGLFDFQNQLSGNDNELLAAACVIIMLPGILIFLVARNAFLEGIAEGAVKG
ncbi:MAG: carbohydrate ABC transporter permease [Blastochloris sp.]|nr:carbohydrate ABC transporter permease [Blastochloris sp.]